MAKKADRPVISIGSSAYPNPRYYGLKGKFWGKVQKYVDELQDIQERAARLAMRSQELAAERDYQQRKHEDACVQAAREGKDEPEPARLDATQRELETVETKRVRHRAAEQSVIADLNRMLTTEEAQDVLADLRERARQHEERYHELVAQAQAERDALGAAYGLHLWVRGVDSRGLRDDYHRFNPAPPSPSYDGSPWHAHPLNCREQEELAEDSIMVVRGE